MSIIWRNGIAHAAIYDPTIRRKRWKSLKTKDERQAQINYGKELAKFSPDKKTNLDWNVFKEEYQHECKPHKKPDTIAFDKIALAKFEAFAKPKTVNDLNPGVLKRWQTALFDEGLKPSSNNRYLGLLKAMGRIAFEKGYIEQDKFSTVKNLRVPKGAGFAYATDQVTLLFNAVQPDKDFDESLFLLAALSTSMRRGEMRNFDIEDVDFEMDVIQTKQKGLWTPKSYKPRWFPLARVLKDRLLKMKAAGHKGAVLTYKGARTKKYFLAKKFYQLLIRAGLVREVEREGEKLKPLGSIHMSRHTWITQMLKLREAPAMVQQWSGHSDIKTTFNVYTHLKPASETEKVDQLPYLGSKKGSKK